MMRGKSFWQLYGGYLVMMVIAAMLIVWGRSYRANQLEANANTGGHRPIPRPNHFT